MLTRDTTTFFTHAHAHALADEFGSATAQAAFLIAPDGFAQAIESARDNHESHQTLNDADFAVHSTRLDAINAGGGSLRCCIGEIF